MDTLYDHFGGLGKIELVHRIGPPKFIIFLTAQTRLCIIIDK